MANATRILAWVLGLVGVALLVDAVRRGTAAVLLVIVFPVVTGGSLEFLAGVAAIFGAFVLGFYSIGSTSALDSGTTESPEGVTTGGSGGVLLVGPVPIFFGSMKRPAPGVVIAWFLLGVALTVAVLLIVLAEPYGL